MRPRSAQIIHVHVGRPLNDVAVGDGYTHVLLIAHVEGAVVGQVMMPAQPVISAQAQWSAICWRFGDAIWRQRLRAELRAAATASAAGARAVAPASVSVVICTRDRPDQLQQCLQSILALRSAPAEIVVVDNAPSDGATRALCETLPVRYVHEPLPALTRARNRGIVESAGAIVAFTDDDCVVDPGWLDDVGQAFADPLIMAVTGYVGPLEVEHTGQYLFERHGGFERHPEPFVIDAAKWSPLLAAGNAGAGANMLLRRDGLEAVGLFAEDLGAGTPAPGGDDKYLFYRLLAAGYRIGYDPGRIVWHRHRPDVAALRRLYEGYTAGEFAYTTRCLVRHRELDALVVWRWWMRHCRQEAKQVLLRRSGRIPADVTASEVMGALRGPWRMVRSARSRRSIPPILPAREPERESPQRIAVGSETPALTVAIASRNRSAMLRRVLEALAAQDYPKDRFEVVLVLDGSSDDSAAMSRTLDTPYPLRVLQQENRGVGATRNRGAREAANPIVVFLDDDIIPVSEFLSEHAAAHAGGDERRVALGCYPPVIESEDPWALAVRAWWSDHFRRKAHPAHQWTFTDFVDGNASLPRDLLFEVGGYDETFRGRRQDWELGIRLLRAGVNLSYHSRAIGPHHVDVTLATGVRNARQEGRDDVRLARKHPDVAPRLPLTRLAWAFANRSPRATAELLALRRLEPLIPPALRALDVLWAARRRRRWWQLANRIMLRSYTLGLVEGADDMRELRAILATAMKPGPTTTEVLHLDQPDGLQLPPAVSMVEVALDYAGHPLGSVSAIDSGGQFDWTAFSERVVHEMADPARLALALATLDRERGAAAPGQEA